MFSSAEKTSKPANVQRQTMAGTGNFLHAKGEESFFAAPEAGFFSGGGDFFASSPVAAVQPKLEVSQPGDKHEQDADTMATQVMAMSEPVAAAGEEKKDGMVHRMEEKKEETAVHRMEDKKEEPAIHRMTEVMPRVQTRLWRKVQGKEDDKTEKEDCHCHETQGLHVVTIDREAISESTGAHIHSHNRGPPTGSPSFESTLYSTKGSGSPLEGSALSFMENRFGADFSEVRVHTDSTAISLSRDIHAQAFTHGSDIYFNTGKYSPHTPDGGFLLAHELTHTIQQGAVSRKVMPLRGRTVDRAAEAQAGPEVSRMEDRATSVDGEVVQRSWLGDIVDAASSLGDLVSQGLEAGKRLLLNQAKELVSHIPGYRALGVVLGEDPISGEHIDRNGHNFIEAAFDIMPGGELLHRKLSELGALTDAEQWVDTQIAAVERLVGGIRTQVSGFISGISLTSLAHPQDLLDRAGNIVRGVISGVVDFAVRAGQELLRIVKRFLLVPIVEFIKTQTTAYPLLRVILQQDPITEEHVERNGTNILNAILELSAEGREQRRQMQETGTFQKVADWIDRGIAIFNGAYEQIVDGFHQIWNLVSIESLMDPVGTFRQIYNIFATPVGRVLSYLAETALMILRFIKEVLMRRLADYAKTVRGYPLVRVLLGKDPFTDEQVPRNVENIIHGFMSLMEGGEEQFQQMQQTGAIARTQQRIDAAVARLNMTPAYIVGLFRDLWNSFHLSDLATPIQTFRRIMAQFGEPIGRLIAFVVEIVKIVIDVLLQVMNFPTNLIANIIARTQQAFQMIKQDPIGFLKNLLRAIKQGFTQFFDKILQYLRDGLISWLLGELRDANVTAPTDFSLRGIIGWVLNILGISMENIWDRLARHPRIGPQRVARIRSMINTLEGIWTFIKDVQERGVAAIWDKIQEQLSNLWNTILDAVKNWIMEQIVNRVVTRLLSMLDPTGIMAVVNSAIALYRAIQTFMRYLREMLEIVNSFVEGVVEIASGNITVAANFLERTLGRAVPIIIGFLANQVGLSGIGRRIAEMIGTARDMVNRAIDWLINRAVTLGGQLLDMARSAAGAVMSWLGLRQPFTNEAGEQHTLSLHRAGSRAELMMESDPMPLLTFINQFAARPGLSPAKVAAANDARTFATTQVQPLMDQLNTAPQGSDTTALERQLLDKMVALTEKLRLLAGSDRLDASIDKYNLEGTAGTFASMPKPTGDDFTADHMPQNALFQVVMDDPVLNIFGSGSAMARHAANRTDAGYAMNEQSERHKKGRTYGGKGTGTKERFRTNARAAVGSASSLQDKKNAIVNEIIADKALDLAEMRSVYALPLTDPVWADVQGLPASVDKTALQTRIRSQATTGIRLVDAQNLDALKA